MNNNYLSNDILKIINKYISTKIYIVLCQYIKNDIHIFKDYFGSYSSYDRAYCSVMTEIKRLYKKYNEHKYLKTERYKLYYYENIINEKLVNYTGTIEYTDIYTTTYYSNNDYDVKKSSYIYQIQEQYLNNKTVEDGVGRYIN